MARPTTGYRLADGTHCPGVTTIIGRWKEFGGLLKWAWQQGRDGFNLNETRDKAADVGTYVHTLIESRIDRELAAPPVPKDFTAEQAKQAAQAYEAYLEWESRTKLTVVRKEESLVCEHHRFGGTYDADVMIGDKLAVLDWKSSKGLYYDYVIQLAAYLHLHEDHYPQETVEGIHIIRFGKTGCDFTHRYFRADHPALAVAWRQFVLFREAYDADRELKKLGA